MRTVEIAEELSAFAHRGAGTDAERRAALWLGGEIATPGGRSAEIEPFWCRPQWALAQAWHVALGIAGSLVGVSSPKLGAGLVLAALLCVLADAVYGVSPGRRLTPERASQNVTSLAPPRGNQAEPRVRLILTANYDAGRAGLVQRDGLRRASTWLRRRTGGLSPGWAGWLALTLAWVLVTTLLRVQGDKGGAVALAQLVPTVGLVVALALLLELGTSESSPGAGDNGAGVAAAIALTKALDAAPPAHAGVELVLTGAGDGQGIGLRHHLRARRRTLDATNAIVLGFGPCGAGDPRWLESDGPLLPLAFFRPLRRLAAETAETSRELGLGPARTRTVSPALPARQLGLPALTLLALGPAGRAPHSHQSGDTPEHLHAPTAESIVQAGLLLVDAIDGYLGTLSRA